MDKAVLVLLCGSYALTVYHKVFGDNFVYLLQPCHVNLLLLIFTMVGPRESKVTKMAFNSYLHYIWATIFALSFPDTTENGLWLVIENFWLGKALFLFFFISAPSISHCTLIHPILVSLNRLKRR